MQRSLFLKLQPALIYIYLPSLQSVLHVFTVLQRSLFLKLQPALIYIYLRLCNLYFTYLQSCSDLFPENFNLRSYISISVSAICTSRIYSLAAISFRKTSTCAHIYLSPSLQSVLHVSTVLQRSLFLKLQPCAHIYLSPSLQSVLHVFTVLQRSLSLKLQPALIYIYLRLCNLYFTYLQSCSDLFSGKLQPALIYIYLRLCNLYFTYYSYSLAAISFP